MARQLALDLVGQAAHPGLGLRLHLGRSLALAGVGPALGVEIAHQPSGRVGAGGGVAG